MRAGLAKPRHREQRRGSLVTAASVLGADANMRCAALNGMDQDESASAELKAMTENEAVSATLNGMEQGKSVSVEQETSAWLRSLDTSRPPSICLRGAKPLAPHQGSQGGTVPLAGVWSASGGRKEPFGRVGGKYYVPPLVSLGASTSLQKSALYRYGCSKPRTAF